MSLSANATDPSKAPPQLCSQTGHALALYLDTAGLH
jgi:hypothetical protein